MTDADDTVQTCARCGRPGSHRFLALVVENERLTAESAGWKRQLQMQTDTSEELIADRDRLRDGIHTFYIKWADTGREPDWSAIRSLIDPEVQP